MSNYKVFDPMLIANYLVYLSKEEGKSITNLKLQKILYFVNARYLVDNDGHPLMKERFERWAYGPVMYTVYSNFRHFGSNPISHTIGSYVYDGDNPFQASFEPFDPSQIPDGVKKLAREVFNKLITKDPFELVDITHKEKLWSSYSEQISNRTAPDYSNDEIYQYFLNNDKEQVWK